MRQKRRCFSWHIWTEWPPAIRPGHPTYNWADLSFLLLSLFALYMGDRSLCSGSSQNRRGRRNRAKKRRRQQIDLARMPKRIKYDKRSYTLSISHYFLCLAFFFCFFCFSIFFVLSTRLSSVNCIFKILKFLWFQFTFPTPTLLCPGGHSRLANQWDQVDIEHLLAHFPATFLIHVGLLDWRQWQKRYIYYHAWTLLDTHSSVWQKSTSGFTSNSCRVPPGMVKFVLTLQIFHVLNFWYFHIFDN